MAKSELTREGNAHGDAVVAIDVGGSLLAIGRDDAECRIQHIIVIRNLRALQTQVNTLLVETANDDSKLFVDQHATFLDGEDSSPLMEDVTILVLDVLLGLEVGSLTLHLGEHLASGLLSALGGRLDIGDHQRQLRASGSGLSLLEMAGRKTSVIHNGAAGFSSTCCTPQTV